MGLTRDIYEYILRYIYMFIFDKLFIHGTAIKYLYYGIVFKLLYMYINMIYIHIYKLNQLKNAFVDNAFDQRRSE